MRQFIFCGYYVETFIFAKKGNLCTITARGIQKKVYRIELCKEISQPENFSILIKETCTNVDGGINDDDENTDN